MKTIKQSSIVLTLFACLQAVSGCSLQAYRPQPIDPAASIARYSANDPHGAEFVEYLTSQGYAPQDLPVRQWGLRELTLSAFYFHPQLEVARAQLQAAKAAEVTAGQRPNPSISVSSGRSEDEAAPWIYSLSFNIPLQTAAKRQVSLAQAAHLSEAARLDIGKTAWLVRSRLQSSLLDYRAALAQVAILEKERALRQQIVAMLQARLEAGMISSSELSMARIQLQQTQQSLNAESGRSDVLRAAVASNAGLSLPTFNRLRLQALEFEQIATSDGVPRPLAVPIDPAGNSKEQLQQAALLNRLDIRASLARYAAAEARLKLEIARQYPDITLLPAYSYEEGFNIWSLGISALLPLLHNNEGLIAEARALRRLEATQFYALQATVLGELEQAAARYAAAVDELADAEQLELAQTARSRQIQQQFETGYADRLEVTTAKLEAQLARRNLLAAAYKVRQAAGMLEESVQQPLLDEPIMPPDLPGALAEPDSINH